MSEFYKRDLAYIHDVGFDTFAGRAADYILTLLNNENKSGLVVDLGCGTGVLSEKFLNSGYRIYGIDISKEMIERAKARLPNCKFKVGSFFEVEIPKCNTVVSTGECLNYIFDKENNLIHIRKLFNKIYNSLDKDGYFIFDLLEPNQIRKGERIRNYTKGDDWFVLVEKHEDISNQILIREIITFCKIGAYYRKSEEIHKTRLYPSSSIQSILEEIGFRVKMRRSYGKFRLGNKHAVFICRK